jgi:hypothetical protein
LGDQEEALQDLQRQLEGFNPSFLLFFVGGERDFSSLARRMAKAYPAAFSLGCSTCGEIGPEGLMTGGISVFAYADFGKTTGVLLHDLASFQFGEGEELVSELLKQGGWSRDEILTRPQDFLFLVLGDGLSGMEDVLLASLSNALPSVPLIGGSAGDDFRFQKTMVAMGEKGVEGGSVISLIEPRRPFFSFQTHGYVSTEKTLVPTSADPERRLIHRIDGRPAVDVLAELLGLEPSYLMKNCREIFSQNQLVFGHGGEGFFFLRAVMGLRGTSALMGGAVEEGLVLHLMEGVHPAKTIRRELLEQSSMVHRIEGMLLFQCGGRLLVAQERGEIAELSRALCFQEFPCAGFVTYGEYFGPLQLNHTITGVVFGAPE